MPQIDIFTDGSCPKNPGPGGWAAILQSGNKEKIVGSYAYDTTNNRAELFAVIDGLDAVLSKHAEIHIWTDSEYVRMGATEWLEKWKARGWRTKKGKPVKNQDLWRDLDRLLAQYKGRLNFHWVRGHNGHAQNERADTLAGAQSVIAQHKLDRIKEKNSE
jgi:ribonuclease HI